MPFSDLGLHPLILSAVQDAGYTEPTPIQSTGIPIVLTGSDVIGIAQTGTGKTAAFTLPILTKLAEKSQGEGHRRRTRVLILAPTRELVAQIEENVLGYARNLPLKIAKVFGGVGEKPQKDALRAGSDIVIACPGRLLDLMSQRCADFSQLEYLVLDEADRMLDMGFLPDIRRVIQQLPKKRQTLLFSATLSKEIESLTHEFQKQPKTVQVGQRSNPAETVTQLVYEVPKHLKMGLLQHLLDDDKLQMVLVFSRTKHGADRIARKLGQVGITCATLHANRSQNQRLRALEDFKSWKVRVLVATDIAARGIDVDGISHVINFDFPHIVEDYIHRIGRTGRAQAIGDAISFVCPEEQDDLRKLERFIGRGLVRKKAEAFNYNAPPSEPSDARPERRQDQNKRRQHDSRGNERRERTHAGHEAGKSQQEHPRGGKRHRGHGAPATGKARHEGQKSSHESAGQSRRRNDGKASSTTEGKPKAGVRGLWNRLTGRK